MPVKKLKPITPGQRFRLAPDFSILSKVKPEKKLLMGIKSQAGRNNAGRITVPHRGGGHKRRLRIIDFKRQKYNIKAKVKTIEYDPIRTSYISLVCYEDGEKKYILTPENLKVGAEIESGEKVAPELGNSLLIKNAPMGTLFHNIELFPQRGGQLARSAGTYAQLVAKEGKFVTLKLPSGEIRMVSGNCMGTVGIVSNAEHMNVRKGKAGRNRWLGRRPRVRGVAMNPVDHPMGGGEGKASGGHPRSKTGLYAKGKKTRDRKKYSNKLIISKPKKK